MIIEVEYSGGDSADGTLDTIEINVQDYLDNFDLSIAYSEDKSFNRMIWEVVVEEGNKRFGKDGWDSYSIEGIRWW